MKIKSTKSERKIYARTYHQDSQRVRWEYFPLWCSSDRKVIGDARVAIEIKSVEEVLPRHLKGLKTFSEEHPLSRRMIVTLDKFSRNIGEIECLYVLDFFHMLWSEGL